MNEHSPAKNEALDIIAHRLTIWSIIREMRVELLCFTTLQPNMYALVPKFGGC